MELSHELFVINADKIKHGIQNIVHRFRHEKKMAEHQHAQGVYRPPMMPLHDDLKNFRKFFASASGINEVRERKRTKNDSMTQKIR